jgi:hypothetical protein
VSESLKRALAEAVNEGLLNSLLPYLIPRKSGTFVIKLFSGL